MINMRLRQNDQTPGQDRPDTKRRKTYCWHVLKLLCGAGPISLCKIIDFDSVQVRHLSVQVCHPSVQVSHPIMQVSHPSVQVSHPSVQAIHPSGQVSHPSGKFVNRVGKLVT